MSAGLGNIERAACELSGAWRMGVEAGVSAEIAEKARQHLRELAVQISDESFVNTMYRDLARHFATDYEYSAAQALLELGRVLSDMNPEEAARAFDEARALFVKQHRAADVAACDIDYGVCLRAQELFDDAIDHFRAAEAYFSAEFNPLGAAEARSEVDATNRARLKGGKSASWMMMAHNGKIRPV